MKTAVIWAIVIALLIVSLAVRVSWQRNAASGSQAVYTPIPTWTNTSVVSQVVKQRQSTPQPPSPTTVAPNTLVTTVIRTTVVHRSSTPTPSRPMVTINYNMNVRSGPGTNYVIIGTASPGQSFSVTGKNPANSWWKIAYNGHVGWVFGDLVTAINTRNVRIAGNIPTPPKPKESDSVSSAPRRIPGSASPIVMSADQFLSEYDRNAIAAEQRYKGKRVRIEGQITDISRVLGRIYIDVSSGNHLFLFARCYLLSNDASQVTNLLTGMTIAIEGIVDEVLLFGVPFERCKITSP